MADIRYMVDTDWVIDYLHAVPGATAIRHNLTLLTNNRRHFGRPRGLDIISV